MRKSRGEAIERITAWAALVSMAARLIAKTAKDEDIASLRRVFDKHSDADIEFHRTIIRMSRNQVLIHMAENLLPRMRIGSWKTIGEMDRAGGSIPDHMRIIEALAARDSNLAEELVRRHALGLAEHAARQAIYRGAMLPLPREACRFALSLAASPRARLR